MVVLGITLFVVLVSSLGPCLDARARFVSDQVVASGRPAPCVIEKVDVETTVGALAYDSANQDLYMSDGFQLYTVTGSSGNILKAIALLHGVEPTTMAVDDVSNKIYVGSHFFGNVTVVNGKTNMIESYIDVYPATLLSADGLGSVIVVYFTQVNSTSLEESVAVISGNNDTVTTSIPIGNLPGTSVNAPFTPAIDFNNHTNLLYVGYGSSITTISLNPTRIIGSIPVGFYPEGLAIDPRNDLLYVESWFNTIRVINASTGIDQGDISGLSANNQTQSGSVVYYPAGNQIFALVNETLVTIDTQSNSIVGRLAVGYYSTGPITYDSGTGDFIVGAGANLLIVSPAGACPSSVPISNSWFFFIVMVGIALLAGVASVLVVRALHLRQRGK